MKSIAVSVFSFLIGFVCQGQPLESNMVSSVSDADRISLIKNSIDIPSWHEKSFWPLYEKYRDEDREISARCYRDMYDLVSTSATSPGPEAFENGKKLIAHRYEEFTVRKQYYSEITSALNGLIALQFLQTEILLDMVESSSIYDNSVWKKFRFHAYAVSPVQLKNAKRNTLSAAISLSPAEAEKFWSVYTRYEEECDALLGDDYSVYALYTGDATDFTPALSKRLGYDLMMVTERELKLKEKYFQEMNDAVGATLAVRFLAWEDYYSVMSKMHVWADN